MPGLTHSTASPCCRQRGSSPDWQRDERRGHRHRSRSRSRERQRPNFLDMDYAEYGDVFDRVSPWHFQYPGGLL